MGSDGVGEVGAGAGERVKKNPTPQHPGSNPGSNPGHAARIEVPCCLSYPANALFKNQNKIHYNL